MPYRCKDCRNHFSVRKGTAMLSSKVGLQKSANTLYMMTTGIKGAPSMKLYRELEIRQATAWFLMQRIREGFDAEGDKLFPSPVEIGETCIGGREKNKHGRKKLSAGRGGVGKAVAADARGRYSNRVSASVVNKTDKATLRGFAVERSEEGAKVIADDTSAYKGMPRKQNSVNYSVGEHVNGMSHSNGIESFRALLKRGYRGTFHQLSDKHSDRYVQEFTRCCNIRNLDTQAQMSALARGMVGKWSLKMNWHKGLGRD